jgi:predicted AlkP superfamily pyrophosphatase or phosphodiesterase
MIRVSHVLAAAAAALSLTACAASPPVMPEPMKAGATDASAAPVTILISIDAFRPDYLDRGVTPTLSALAASGVRASMRPSFPSKTFPNHYTLVTGLRPDRNGIVENNMVEDAIPGVKFAMSNHDAVLDRRWWDEATPIWVSAERAGIKTGTMFWPGSEAAIQGVRPSEYAAFNQATPAEARVDQALAWLDLPPAQRPRFLTLYFDEVDTAGHHHGPDSPEVNVAAAHTDAAIARLETGLKARGLVANQIIVADHGMAPISPDRVIYIDDILPKDAGKWLATGPFLTYYPVAGRTAEVEHDLIRSWPHMQCWRKADIPARFHYGHNPRVAPIFCLAETDWQIATHASKLTDKGTHGFDNASPEMAAVFIANGPAFRAGARPATFDNVDVYPLLARLLGVAPQPNDGRLADLAGALKH